MYRIQKEIGKLNNGESYIKIPNIRKHQIMDKCILDDLVSQISMDVDVMNMSIRRSNENIEKMFTTISNIVTSITNTATELESIDKIKNPNDNALYEENFINAVNIDMKSNIDIDFSNNYCSLPAITTKTINFDTILINNKKIEVNEIVFQNNSTQIQISNASNTKIKCSFKNSKRINNIFVDIQCSSSVNYEVYNISENQEFLLSTGTSSSSFVINFYPRDIKDLEIRITPIDEDVTAYINNIYCYLKAYKRFAELKTKPLKIYGSSKMKIVTDSNSDEKIKSYIGFINKNNEIIWNAGDTYKTFQLYDDYKKLVSSDSTGFGTVVSDYFKVIDLKDNFNRNSVKVYSGYGMWHRTLVEGAFMNEDLSVIEYGFNDVKERTYVDIDNCSFNITAGQLYILEQNVEVSKDTEIKFIKPDCTDIDSNNKTSLFRYSILVNGERINGSMTLANHYEAKLVAGVNTIQVIFNLKKMETTSSYKVQLNNYFNAKEYTDFIYHKNLKQAATSSLVNDIYRNNYGLVSKSIVVNNVNVNDKFMVVYETLKDSDIHYTDHNGQYLKVIMMVKIFNDNNYNNVKINKVSLIN